LEARWNAAAEEESSMTCKLSYGTVLDCDLLDGDLLDCDLLECDFLDGSHISGCDGMSPVFR
jgi:hypothetical protein